MTPQDQQLERLIEAWRTVLELDPNPASKSLAVLGLRDAIAERSPERVAEMERERGLR